MTETNLGRVAIVPQGDYNEAMQYAVLDAVLYEGSSYVVHTIPPVGTLPTNETYFYLLSRGLSDIEIDAFRSSLLGGIAFNASAPTPAMTGKYIFTSAGSCSWITGGAVTVAVNDEVLVTYTAPSTYVYIYLGVAANFVAKSSIKTEPGNSTTDIVSQKFITDELALIETPYPTVRPVLQTTNSDAGSVGAYYGNLLGRWNPVTDILNTITIQSDSSGTVTIALALINENKAFRILHTQTKSVVSGNNVVTAAEITYDYSDISQDIYVLIKGSASGNIRYKLLDNTALYIPVGGTVVTFDGGYIVGLFLNISTYSLLKNSISLNNAAITRIDADIPLYNVTIGVPLLTGYYTLSTAIPAVPLSIRKAGMKITFQVGENIWETWQYCWEDVSAWGGSSTWFKDVISKFSGTTTELSEIIALGGDIQLEEKTYIVNSVIAIPDGTKIRGCRGKTIIQNSGTGAALYIDSESTVSISGISFTGTFFARPAISTISEIKAKTGISTQIGIEIVDSANRVVINDCEFSFFNHSGIYMHLPALGSNSNKHGLKIDSCFFFNNYIGLNVGFRYEYSSFSNLSFNLNSIGVWCEGGNNVFTNLHCELNYVGFILSGLEAANPGHGAILSSTFNHCYSYAFVSLDAYVGMIISACNFFDTKFYIEDSKGLIFSNSIFSIQMDVNSGAEAHNGTIVFRDNVFFKTYGNGVDLVPFTGITQTGSGLIVSLSGNRYIDGEDSANINNSI